MSIYAAIGGTTNISELVAGFTDCDEAVMSGQYGSVEPTVKPTGADWKRSDSTAFGGTAGPALQWWDGAAWVPWMDLRASAKALNNQGTVAMAADLDLGGNNITGLADPVAGDDAATKDYVDGLAGGAVLADGSVAMAADLDMDNNAIANVANPTNLGDAVNKAYSDLNTPVWGTFTVPAAGPYKLWQNVGFTPARVQVFYNTGGTYQSPVYDPAVAGTDQTESVGGGNLSVARTHFGLAAPDNVNGFRVTGVAANAGKTMRFCAWKQ